MHKSDNEHTRGALTLPVTAVAARRPVAGAAGGNALITVSPATRYGTQRPGPLAGHLLAVKDLITVAGMPTTMGSRFFDPTPSSSTAPVVSRLERAGAAVIGKANLDEYAWGVTGENVNWGRIINPDSPELIAGGSSGGTAAAIASGMATIGLGTDTAGSVRIPAACCRVVGLRPRTGTLPNEGVQGLSPSFDVVGPMAATVSDCALVWQVLSGEQPQHVPDLSELRLGVAPDVIGLEPLLAIRAQLTPLPVPIGVLDPFWTVMRAEAFATHRKQLADDPESFSPALRAKLNAAAAIHPAEVPGARGILERYRSRMLHDLDDYDAWLLPVLGRSIPEAGVDEARIRDALGWPSALVSALDLPSLALGGLQIVARTEGHALAVGERVAQVLGEHPAVAFTKDPRPRFHIAPTGASTRREVNP
ncbi:amidase [Leucobacter sp. M11]|uniref:amidase n=1 Tax=Leucobacter sp. M11 TaxID=2993565 RepID=UPI002D806AD8|nr:amidase [Leucobacter sp. M11]MEB4614459.1 amidase [Leucobacter sp. M11]